MVTAVKTPEEAKEKTPQEKWGEDYSKQRKKIHGDMDQQREELGRKLKAGEIDEEKFKKSLSEINAKEAAEREKLTDGLLPDAKSLGELRHSGEEGFKKYAKDEKEIRDHIKKERARVRLQAMRQGCVELAGSRLSVEEIISHFQAGDIGEVDGGEYQRNLEEIIGMRFERPVTQKRTVRWTGKNGRVFEQEREETVYEDGKVKTETAIGNAGDFFQRVRDIIRGIPYEQMPGPEREKLIRHLDENIKKACEALGVEVPKESKLPEPKTGEESKAEAKVEKTPEVVKSPGERPPGEGGKVETGPPETGPPETGPPEESENQRRAFASDLDEKRRAYAKARKAHDRIWFLRGEEGGQENVDAKRQEYMDSLGNYTSFMVDAAVGSVAGQKAAGGGGELTEEELRTVVGNATMGVDLGEREAFSELEVSESSQGLFGRFRNWWRRSAGARFVIGLGLTGAAVVSLATGNIPLFLAFSGARTAMAAAGTTMMVEGGWEAAATKWGRTKKRSAEEVAQLSDEEAETYLSSHYEASRRRGQRPEEWQQNETFRLIRERHNAGMVEAINEGMTGALGAGGGEVSYDALRAAAVEGMLSREESLHRGRESADERARKYSVWKWAAALTTGAIAGYLVWHLAEARVEHHAGASVGAHEHAGTGSGQSIGRPVVGAGVVSTHPAETHLNTGGFYDIKVNHLGSDMGDVNREAALWYNHLNGTHMTHGQLNWIDQHYGHGTGAMPLGEHHHVASAQIREMIEGAQRAVPGGHQITQSEFIRLEHGAFPGLHEHAAAPGVGAGVHEHVAPGAGVHEHAVPGAGVHEHVAAPPTAAVGVVHDHGVTGAGAAPHVEGAGSGVPPGVDEHAWRAQHDLIQKQLDEMNRAGAAGVHTSGTPFESPPPGGVEHGPWEQMGMTKAEWAQKYLNDGPYAGAPGGVVPDHGIAGAGVTETVHGAGHVITGIDASTADRFGTIVVDPNVPHDAAGGIPVDYGDVRLHVQDLNHDGYIHSGEQYRALVETRSHEWISTNQFQTVLDKLHLSPDEQYKVLLDAKAAGQVTDVKFNEILEGIKAHGFTPPADVVPHEPHVFEPHLGPRLTPEDLRKLEGGE